MFSGETLEKLYDPLVIGLTGNPRAGKDTIRALIEQRYADVVSYAFAQPIYSMLGILYSGKAPSKGDLVPRFGKPLRYMLQTLGTDWGRNMVDENIWVKKADEWYQEIIKTKPNIIIFSDVRFNNEAAYIKLLGGKIYRVIRDFSEKPDYHMSNYGILEGMIDGEITNNGSLEDLSKVVREALRKLI